jgi:hypothetical protein
MRMRLNLSIALLLLIPGLSARADDFHIIKALPERMTAMKKEFHSKADTGVTSNMVEATDQLNDQIKGMLRDLVKAYYKNKPVALKALDKYFDDIERVARDEQVLDNPTGEDEGTIARLYVPGRITEDLTDKIGEMVEAILPPDSDFDFDAWKQHWKDAVKTGD